MPLRDPGDPCDGASGAWQPVVVSSAILSLCLLGDALIYAVLPLHAAQFGISLAWVGVLLSANRFVRVFAYGIIARLTYRVGVRRMCVTATVAAVVSTGLYGFGQGVVILLAARILWGLAYAALLLVTLAYAVEMRSAVGVRIGVSGAIQRLGPITALLLGTWLTGLTGPNNVFILLAGLTLAALPLALWLPPDRRRAAPPRAARSLGRPRPMDLLFFMQGFGVDGVFAITITLILAKDLPVSMAVLSGGALLAMRHVGEGFAAPLFGWVADRFGARQVFMLALMMTVFGFCAIALGYTIAGALVMLIFRGALASLGPALIVQSIAAEDPAVGALARMQAWRDLGAALGPLTAGFALAVVSAEFQHAVVAVLLAFGLLFALRRDGLGRRQTQ